MANDSKMLGDWANQGYFLKYYGDQVTINYKDDGSKELAAFDRGIANPEAIQLVCSRHNAALKEVKV